MKNRLVMSENNVTPITIVVIPYMKGLSENVHRLTNRFGILIVNKIFI